MHGAAIDRHGVITGPKIVCLRERGRFAVVDLVRQARHLRHARRDCGRETLAARNQLITAVATADEKRLDHAVQRD